MSTEASSRGSSSGAESSRAASPRRHGPGKQSNSRATRSEYAAFKALLRRPSALQARPPKSRSISRRASTLAPSSVAPSDSDSDISLDDDGPEHRWPTKTHFNLAVEPRLDDLIKSFASEYIRRKRLAIPAQTDVEETAPPGDGAAAQLDHGPDAELLSTLSTNVMNKLNQTLVTLAAGHRQHRSTKLPLTGLDVLGAHNLASIPEPSTWLESFSDIVEDTELKPRRLDIVRGALKTRPLPPRAAFYAPVTPKQDRGTAKYFERARKRNKRVRLTTTGDS